mmetsp:Transcript_11910/g.41052  ORF Transcript_11910/g.41052 Transcript_11910/m.41052 type:complete len:110 (-) Transcript_11910:58-387(-)
MRERVVELKMVTKLRAHLLDLWRSGARMVCFSCTPMLQLSSKMVVGSKEDICMLSQTLATLPDLHHLDGPWKRSRANAPTQELYMSCAHTGWVTELTVIERKYTGSIED